MENENIQPQETAQEGGFTFVSEQEVAQAMAEPQAEPTPQPEEQPEPQPEPQAEVQAEPQVEQPTQEAAPEQQEYTDSQVEEAVFSFLSERLGRDVKTLDDLSQPEAQPELDERIAVIADFVNKTGRDPMDWFKYQSVNPSEMDDMTAIATHMRTQYPDLSDKEINVLMKNKYTVDPDLHDEGEVQISHR
jgi:outer membrane biosynthesis protein TonB